MMVIYMILAWNIVFFQNSQKVIEARIMVNAKKRLLYQLVIKDESNLGKPFNK